MLMKVALAKNIGPSQGSKALLSDHLLDTYHGNSDSKADPCMSLLSHTDGWIKHLAHLTFYEKTKRQIRTFVLMSNNFYNIFSLSRLLVQHLGRGTGFYS